MRVIGAVLWDPDLGNLESAGKSSAGDTEDNGEEHSDGYHEERQNCTKEVSSATRATDIGYKTKKL